MTGDKAWHFDWLITQLWVAACASCLSKRLSAQTHKYNAIT